ncbi:hypothetical protein ABUR76_14010, partial [Staphylococcus aureus]
IKPGDQKVTGTTMPNHIILLNIDGKSVDSVDGEDSSFITSKEDGKFEYPLNNRKIVHNQEIEVSSSSLDDLGEDDEEVEEDSTEKSEAEEE